MGASFDFTGAATNDIDYGDLTMLDGATEFSCLHWTLFAAAPPIHDSFFGKSLAGGSRFYSYVDNGKDWFMNIDDGNRRSIRWDGLEAAASVNVWYHFAWTWKAAGSSMLAYRNGVSLTVVEAVTGTPASIPNSTGHYTIASLNTDHRWPMNGNHSYFRMYDRQLSQNEIKEEMWMPGSIVKNLVFAPDLTDTAAFDPITGTTPTVTGAVLSSDGPPVNYKKLMS